MKLGFSLPEIQDRFKSISDSKEKEKVGTHPVPFGSGTKWLDVFEVPLELPRYRLDNTRTLHLQMKYISDHDLPTNYFEKDIWSDKLQEIQHSILKSLIERKGLKDFFEKDKNLQTDPLILTSDGFVISGNRRLCAFRELYFVDPKGQEKYKKFERIRAVILPICSDEEIEHIEDALEQQPDIKDEFSWISKALGFEKRIEKHGYTSKMLAEKSGFKKADIDSLLQQLTFAKEYLISIGKPNEYDLVLNDKYAFEEIEKGRKNIKSSSAKKDLFQKLSFIALKNPENEISGRMYANIPLIQENIEAIEDEIRSEFEDEVSKIELDGKQDNPLNDSTLFPDKSLGTLQLLDNGDYHKKIFEILIEKVTEAKFSKEESSRKRAVVKKVQRAYGLLIEANNMRSGETDKAGVLKLIANIEKQLKELKEWATK